jgi:hypothetical protein
LVIEHEGVELRAHGSMVAFGPAFKPWRVEWAGEQIEVSLGKVSIEKALRIDWR